MAESPAAAASPTITESGRVHLAWALTDGVGPQRFAQIIEHFGDAATALALPPAELGVIKGIGRETIDGIARSRDPARVEAEIAAAAEQGVRIIGRGDPDYPAGLAKIADPPIVLYVKGELLPTDAIAVAVVGSRRCTIYGSEQARRFAELLAQAGFTVVSGLARGIDSFAHYGAIEAGGRSIAVMGNGLDQVYPPENRPLADKLLEHGAWISELPIRTDVRARNFHARNRIIAGMTLGTLVVEAAQKSGALITARLANEYNREVFAVPGRVQDPMSLGTNALIRDGAAKLVTCLEDILDELGDVGRMFRAAGPGHQRRGASAASVGDHAANTRQGELDLERSEESAGTAERQPQPATPRRDLNLSSNERRVYELIGCEPVLQDALLRAAELPVGEVLAAFTTLELKGLVKRLPGQLVVRRGTA
jgi:DNA processing protein